MARLGRGFPNRPYVAHTHPGDSQDASTPTVWAAGPPDGRWKTSAPQDRWATEAPRGRWRAAAPRGG